MLLGRVLATAGGVGVLSQVFRLHPSHLVFVISLSVALIGLALICDHVEGHHGGHR